CLAGSPPTMESHHAVSFRTPETGQPRSAGVGRPDNALRVPANGGMGGASPPRGVGPRSASNSAAAPSNYNVTVNILDRGGSTAIATSTAIVTNCTTPAPSRIVHWTGAGDGVSGNDANN